MPIPLLSNRVEQGGEPSAEKRSEPAGESWGVGYDDEAASVDRKDGQSSSSKGSGGSGAGGGGGGSSTVGSEGCGNDEHGDTFEEGSSDSSQSNDGNISLGSAPE